MRVSTRSLYLVIFFVVASSFYLYCTEETMLRQIGGYTLHITDVLFVVLIFYAVLGALHGFRVSIELLLLGLCALLVLSFVRGVFTWGVSPAGVQFRQVAVFVALATFVYFWLPYMRVERILGMIIFLGWLIVLLSIGRLIFGYGLFVLQERDPSYEFRTLNGEAAFMLGQASLIAVERSFSSTDAGSRLRSIGTSFAFVLTLIISDQRTAEFATLAGVATIFFLSPLRYRAAAILFGIVTVVALASGFLVLWVEYGQEAISYLPHALSMIVLGDETFGAREELWRSYLEAYSTWPLLDQILGQPFGGTHLALSRSTDDYILLSPHNGYIALLVNVGATGLLLFVATLGSALTKGFASILRRRGDVSGSRLRLAVAIVISQAVFSYGYLLPNDQGLLLALALHLIARSARVPALTAHSKREAALVN